MRALYRISQIHDIAEKQAIARAILETLPEWFGIPEAREDDILQVSTQVAFSAFHHMGAYEKPVGFLCLKETGKDTLELSVMGVLKECHRKGIGTKLFTAAKNFAVSRGYSFLQVKTVQMGGEALPETLPVAGSDKQGVTLRMGQRLSMTLPIEQAQGVESRVLLPRFLYAPVLAGERVGRVQYLMGGEEIYSVPIIASEEAGALELPERSGWERFTEWVMGLSG